MRANLTIAMLVSIQTLILFSGCSVSGPRESPLPKSGPKMIDIYKQHMEEMGSKGAAANARTPNRHYGDEEFELGRTPSAISRRFVRLPNPDLEMYVYPHLSRGRYPVPGYSTVFPMFESVQYALPGEVAPPMAKAAPRLDRSVIEIKAPTDDSSNMRRRVLADLQADISLRCGWQFTPDEFARAVAHAKSGTLGIELARRYTALAAGEAEYATIRTSTDCGSD